MLTRIFIVTIISFILLGCSKPEPKQSKHTRPLVVQLSEVIPKTNIKHFEFPATVSAVKDVNLKFELAGRLIEVNLTEGQNVKKGDLLAKIDPSPFQRQVAASKIRLDLATAELDRVKKMYEKGVASKSLFDNAKSAYDIAELTLANAEQDLSYTELRAPFDAIVSARFIDNNSYVNPEDTLATLQDVSTYYFTFDVPEKLVAANPERTNFVAHAQLLSNKSQKFSIHYVEHQTQPDPITQTYSVTFALDKPQVAKLTPGTRATVFIRKLGDDISQDLLPLSALVGDKDQGFNVWVYNKNTQQVSSKKVRIISIEGNFAVIAPDLPKGSKVVSAAANKMREGLAVKEYSGAQ